MERVRFHHNLLIFFDYAFLLCWLSRGSLFPPGLIIQSFRFSFQTHRPLSARQAITNKSNFIFGESDSYLIMNEIDPTLRMGEASALEL